MSGDDEYMSFLDKANQPTGGNDAKTASKGSKDSKFASTKAVDTDVPAPLKDLGDSFYTSDTDEPFEPVALGHTGKEIDKRNFAKLIGHDGEVEATDVQTWNKSKQYDDVVKKVSECSDGNHVVKVFRVDHGGTRAEYYVVVLSKEGNVVGVKAKAVES